MVLGVKEYHSLYSIEEYYSNYHLGRFEYVGASMSASTNYCDFLNVYTPYYARSGGFDFALYFARYVYSLNYAVVTLSIYRGEEYSLVEMSVLLKWWLWWLENKNRQEEVELRLLRPFPEAASPRYSNSTTTVTTNDVITIIQEFTYYYKSISPTPTSVAF